MPEESMYPNPEGDDSPSMEKPQDAADNAPESETALIPKSLFGDKDPEPGHKCEFEVVHVYDDEVEVKYSKSGEGDKKSSYSDADSKLDKMASLEGEPGPGSNY